MLLINDLKKKISKCKSVTKYSMDTGIEDIDSVQFGAYPQGKDGEREFIDWIILKKDKEEALLLSKYILDYLQFDENEFDNYYEETNFYSWYGSNVEKWLHQNFIFSAFDRDAIDALLDIEIEYYKYSQYSDGEDENLMKICVDIVETNNTKNKITLMSVEECKKYFNKGKLSSNKIITRPTKYAKEIHNKFYNNLEKHDKNPNNNEKVFSLRDVNYSSSLFLDEYFCRCYSYVDVKGSVNSYENKNKIIGIRPMIKINLEKII